MLEHGQAAEFNASSGSGSIRRLVRVRDRGLLKDRDERSVGGDNVLDRQLPMLTKRGALGIEP